MMNPHQTHTLLALARASIQQGLKTHAPLIPHETDAALHQPGASFVTLNKRGELRGCIGSLQAHLPLAEDVARNAFNAAFKDPRFAPVTAAELAALDIHISILSPSAPLKAASERDLLQQLRPGIDGLVLQDENHRATFLPQVWASLPEPADFLAHLKRKAGLPADYWSPSLTFERYTVENLHGTALPWPDE